MRVVPYIGRFQAIEISLFSFLAGVTGPTALEQTIAGGANAGVVCFVFAIAVFAVVASIATPRGRRCTLEPHEIEIANTPAIYFKGAVDAAELRRELQAGGVLLTDGRRKTNGQ